jgi:branched-chain amino acid transport system permease protein
VAATALTLFPEVFQFARDYKLLIFGLLLIAVAFLMPDGIAGAGRKAVGWWRLDRMLGRSRPREPRL